MQLYYIRHAQSVNNRLWQTTGSSVGRSEDPGLTELGSQQARFLANFLCKENQTLPLNDNQQQNVSGFGITHLYSSLMMRSLQTGTEVARALGISMHGWVDLHETGGIYLDDEETGQRVGQAGKDRTELLDAFPELVLPESVGIGGWWNRPFEEREDRLPRAQRVVADLLAWHGDTPDRVALIGHGGFFNYFMAALLKLTERRDFWFAMNNVAITRIDVNADGIVVTYLNRLDFLPPELIT